MIRAVGIAGKKSSGKSTAADGLPDEFVALDFATPLKEMLQDGLGLGWGQLWGGRKEDPDGERLCGATPRVAMQTLGAWGRAIHPDFWTRMWLREADRSLADGYHVAAADVRFPGEVEAIRSRGGLVVWIERPGLVSSDPDPTENSIGPDDCDLVLVNDLAPETLRRRLWGALR